MRVTAAIALGESGNASELRGFENPVRDAQPAHVGILVRRDVKQAEEPPAEIVRRLRIFALGRVVFEPFIGVEGMLFALEFFRVRKFAAGRENRLCAFSPAASGPAGSGAAAGLTGRGTTDALRRLGDLHAGDKAFQVAFLFGIKIAVLAGGDGLRSASFIRPAPASAP